jgi:hypothetical protein
VNESGPKSAHSLQPEEIQLLIAQYEFAHSNRSSADATAWEMTSIVWGGQTLLLGFVLEAIPNREAQFLIILVGVLGLLFCCFNHAVMRSRNTVCNAMIDVCREIEQATPVMNFKPQERLDKIYEKRTQRTWFWMVNYSFAIVWLAVILTAMYLICHIKPASLGLP